MAMDAKDLRIGTALGERNDGSKYSQSGIALQCTNKSYQDIGSNPLAKAEVAAVRPCAVIGPDRVMLPSASDAYPKKGALDQWPCPDNLYPRPPEYPQKQLNNVNPSRNISPRQTFQENMQRIMVPPTYSAVKHADESNSSHVEDRNAVLSKTTKQTIAPEAKYCDVPYAVNLLTNEHKNVRETEMCVPSVNSSPLTRAAPHGWPGGVNMHPPRTYGAHDVYQYSQYPSCAGPRPPIMPMIRPHRAFQEDPSYVYPDSYYQDASVRFKPYPTVKERYPQARYDYINNYPNPFHPPPPYASHKYDIPNTRPPHPYSVYPHLKYLDNRPPDPNIEGYQRSNQQSNNYNMLFRNQVIHPTYGNPQNKVPSYPSDKSSNKLSLDNNKSYVDYENAKTKYSLPDSYFANEMARVHQVQKPVAMPNYASPGIHPVPLQQYHRKDNMGMKSFEYMPHYRHFEHPLGFNPSGHHPPQFSPSALAISPTDSNTSNDTTQTQGTSQEDCGYVSQSSTTSARSFDSNINRLHNEYYRRYDYRYRPIIGNSHTLAKSDMASKDSQKIDVRQFLSMWSEGDEDNTNNNSKEISTTNNYRRQESGRSQDQLYVLGLVNVPSDELAKYEHIQKVSKLPENIKGYNSIELLNQFEEVIELSNMNNFKSSVSKDFFQMKDRKNAIKQIVEVLPRPVSPLDVEAKISQSVIHKEVGCNFEIKPCSPKMLNVEIAAPVQNILVERSIEKISNPLSNKAKSPLPMKIDGNTACNSIQRQESKHGPYENVSCKMIGSQFTAESVKSNYSLHDLETSSGVCLASLPRLDNEIELNFPEVNQQFINANKISRNLQEEEVRDDNKNLTPTGNDKAKNDEKYSNVSVEDSGTKLSKLSKFRKAKVNFLEYLEDESKANPIRTDSVIIENPENVRKYEDNKEKISVIDENENTPINLTSQTILPVESESNTLNSSKPETDAMECALDFSFSKSENELPSLNVFDEEISHKVVFVEPVTSHCSGGDHIKENMEECPNKASKQSSECTSNETNIKSRIVRNNHSLICDYKKTLKESVHFSSNKQNDASPECLEKTDLYSSRQIVRTISRENDGKITDDINFDENKTNLTNVIVKYTHENESKVQPDVITSNIEHSWPSDNENYEIDHTCIEETSKNAKAVIQNNNLSEDDDVSMEVTATDICKDELCNTSPAYNSARKYHNTEISEIVEDKSSLHLSVNEDSVKNYKKTTYSVELDDSVNKPESKNTTRVICDSGEFSEYPDTNKYYNDLISESELFLDKKYCIGAENQSSSTAFAREEIASADVINILDNLTEEQSSGTKTSENTNDESNLAGSSTAPNKQSVFISESESLEHKQCNIDNNDKPNMNSFEKVFENTVDVAHSQCLDEKVIENNDNKNVCKKTSSAVNPVFEEIEVLDKINAITSTVNRREHCTMVTDAQLVVDKQNSIDSVYQTNKNSFAESDAGIIEFSGNSSEDSVFGEQELETKQITTNYFVENNNESKKRLQPVSDISSSPICSNKANILEHKTFDDSSNKMEVQLKTFQLDSVFDGVDTNKQMDNNDTLRPISDRSISTNAFCTLLPENENSEDSNMKVGIHSNLVFDNVDANMQILFSQPNKETLSVNVSVERNDILNFVDKNTELQKENDLPKKIEISHSKKEFDKVDQTLLNINNELNPNKIIPFQNNKDEVNEKTNLKDCFNILVQNKNKNTTNSVEITDVVLDEPLTKSLNKDQRDTEFHASNNISSYRGKELYSPRIQKLMLYMEGKYNVHDINDIKTKNKIKQLSNVFEITLLENQSINNAIKEATLHNADNEVHTKEESELIHEVYQKIDVACENLNPESNSKNSIDCFNDESSSSFDAISNQGRTVETDEDLIKLTEQENKLKFDNNFIEECTVQNDLVDTQEISFNYPNNSIISHITENVFNTNDTVFESKIQDQIETGLQINQRWSLKRSFSDSALSANVSRNDETQGFENLNYSWPSKRNKMGEFMNYLPINRRNSVNIEENVSFCILIDDNCIITEENDEKICIAELQEDFITEIETANDGDDSESLNGLDTNARETDVDYSNSVVLGLDEENPSDVENTWVENLDVFSDEVGENVVISAPSSPSDSTAQYEHNISGIYGNTTPYNNHTDEVKFLHEENMSKNDAQNVDTLYKTHPIDIMNKTLLYGDKDVESNSDDENIMLESDNWRPSPTNTPDYIDPTHASNDFRLETPENKENVFVKELSPLRRIDDYLDVSSAENETDEHIHRVVENEKLTQDSSVYSYESSLHNVFDYNLKDRSIDTAMPTSSSSPEVSSTTSEEKSSSILLKITNLNGSRVSQINEIELNNRPRCKFTEKKDYSSSNLNFPNRPLMTKAAQKYIPPIKESIRDLKVKISLPQQSLMKLKQLKLSRNEPKLYKQQCVIPRITKKPKPNFDDVLKSIDEIQIKRHKEKSKKMKTVVPKVLIKKNENGSHYASTRDTFSPDLTGRRWQPWVFLEKNNFIDKMAVQNKMKAIFSHRKNTYVLAEKFKKYKSVSSAKFVISEPKTPGQLKYTIRLKHSY